MIGILIFFLCSKIKNKQSKYFLSFFSLHMKASILNQILNQNLISFTSTVFSFSFHKQIINNLPFSPWTSLPHSCSFQPLPCLIRVKFFFSLHYTFAGTVLMCCTYVVRNGSYEKLRVFRILSLMIAVNVLYFLFLSFFTC